MARRAWPALGLHDGVTDLEYHRHASLSASGAKILATRTPAEYAYHRDNPPRPKAEFDLGHAFHRGVLSVGAELKLLEHENYNTKAAREERDQAYADGLIPLTPKQHKATEDMVDAVREHELAGALFDTGVAEQSGVWMDQTTGILCRWRPDWMVWIDGRLYIVDLKSTADADPVAFHKSAFRWGYHQQDPWYVEGAVHTLGVDPADVTFLFVAVCSKPPHLVSVHYLDADAIAEGERLNARARRIWARCNETGHWPGYPLGPHRIRLPKWHNAARFDDEEFDDVA